MFFAFEIQCLFQFCFLAQEDCAAGRGRDIDLLFFTYHSLPACAAATKGVAAIELASGRTGNWAEEGRGRGGEGARVVSAACSGQGQHVGGRDEALVLGFRVQ